MLPSATSLSDLYLDVFVLAYENESFFTLDNLLTQIISNNYI